MRSPGELTRCALLGSSTAEHTPGAHKGSKPVELRGDLTPSLPGELTGGTHPGSSPFELAIGAHPECSPRELTRGANPERSLGELFR